MILGHVKCGQAQKVLELFKLMQQDGVQPNSVAFAGVLNACASMVVLEEGGCVHHQIIQSGLESEMSLWGIVWLTYMQTVGALRILGECSTRCHLKMWSLGAP